MSAPSSPAFVYDEQNQYWIIFPGDPGWPALRALWMRGAREIGLPRSLILGGDLTEPKVPATLTKWDTSNPETADMIKRIIRLRDCVDFLKKHPPEE